MPLFRCEAVVEHRDQLRFKKGKGFRMHFNKERCKKAAAEGGLCRQHQKVQNSGAYVRREPTWN